MNGSMMKLAALSLRDYVRGLGREINAEEIAGIIEGHALATAVSAAAAGVIPGAGGGIAFGIACASTITMYGRLASTIGVRLNKGLLKAIASAVVAGLAAAIAATVTVAAAVSFIPGVGSMASATLTGISNFGFVYLAGIIFIKMVTSLGISQMEKMSEEELTSAAKRVQSTVDVKSGMKEAKKVFKANSR